jgi:hypothetical protein
MTRLAAAICCLIACLALAGCAENAAISPVGTPPSSAGLTPSPVDETVACADEQAPAEPLVIEVRARSFTFDTDPIEGPRACEPFVIEFFNQDGDAPTSPEDRKHDIDIRAENLFGDLLFDGELIGPGEIRYEVPGLPAGEHYFYCSNHGDMSGTLVVEP